MNRLWLEIQVPVDRITGVAIDSPVRLPAQEVSGRVIAIGRAVAGSTQTISVRAEVRKGAERLRAGQLVEAVLGGTGGQGVWSVPVCGHCAQQWPGPGVCRGHPADSSPRSCRWSRRPAVNALVAAPFKGSERVATKGVATLKAIEAGIGGVQ